MIKEIRIGIDDILSCPPEDYNVMRILKEKGFPVDDTFMFALKPKAGLEYYEFTDPKTGELVVRWEEPL